MSSSLTARAPGGLYLHVPFCRRKCGYCDFRSEPCGEAIDPAALETYLTGLAREIDRRAPLLPAVATVYLGGGTPSLLPDAALGAILGLVRDRFDVAPDAEVTLEANPCDLADPGRPARLAALGFNRLSLGVQSLDDRVLARLGRPHDAAAARRALAAVASAPGLALSLDLIYAVPGTTPDDFRRDLAAALAFAPRHLSCYALSIPEGTPMAREVAAGQLAPLDAAAEADFLEAVHAALAAAGRPAYEVSNFAASPADRSRHNLGYWTRRPYLGLGPAAHSFLPEPGGGRRFWNAPALESWAAVSAEAPPFGEERLGPADAAFEALFLGLRWVGGVDFEALRADFGRDLLERNRPLIRRLVVEGFATLTGSRLCPTPAGLARADGIATAFRLD